MTRLAKAATGVVTILQRDERVVLNVLRACYIAGRRRRPGERVVVLRDEAQFALADRVAELVRGDRKTTVVV